ncbi:LLM class flavin-dependent oxidoreductase [Nocardioides sp.]|uniref:LLM class flavin-dependent oxidoreductase n=1 Tax=Nocardioides sp. TaxID=35761 RepID=UPI00262732EB|nr:LLM class flavin-dependent oxidoreductase [Nocardioides sp.]
MSAPLHLAVALDGAGWHPGAWAETGVRPGALFTPGYWADLVARAESGLLDLVTIEDGLRLQSEASLDDDPRTDRIRGRLDAVQIAARVAPLTQRIGLLPTAVVTHTEPFHLSKAIATLDYVSRGRAGVRVQVDASAVSARHLGRREQPAISLRDYAAGDPAAAAVVADLFTEAGDYVEVLRRLWDSWEDDAEIRDVATGRFVDVDRLHYIDFEGSRFSVRGPSITPRPPQGQPIVAALAHAQIPFTLVADHTDLGFLTPHSNAEAAELVTRLRALRLAGPAAAEPLHLWADLVVVLGETDAHARSRLARLDDLAGAPFRSDAELFVGTPTGLADLLADWHSTGLTGFRLRPAVLPDDLDRIVTDLTPELRRRGLVRTAYEADTLRGHLGLTRPANRYAPVGAHR